MQNAVRPSGFERIRELLLLSLVSLWSAWTAPAEAQPPKQTEHSNQISICSWSHDVTDYNDTDRSKTWWSWALLWRLPWLHYHKHSVKCHFFSQTSLKNNSIITIQVMIKLFLAYGRSESNGNHQMHYEDYLNVQNSWQYLPAYNIVRTYVGDNQQEI